MCAGLPVISTTSGGIPEVIDPNKTGLLVEPKSSEELAKAIHELSMSSEMRVAMGQAARQAAEQRFTPEVYCQQLSELYRSILK